MLLKCTADMQKELNIKAETVEETDRLYSWCVHVVKVARRKCVVLMNCASKYYIVLYGLCAKDFHHLTDNVLEYIKQSMQSYHISSEMIDSYLKDCGEIVICKNNNRSDISRINQACTQLKNYADPAVDFCGDGLFKARATALLNNSMLYKEKFEKENL